MFEFACLIHFGSGDAETFLLGIFYQIKSQSWKFYTLDMISVSSKHVALLKLVMTPILMAKKKIIFFQDKQFYMSWF